ncbi:hypothetical protein A4X06_0g8623 [Tilletia controversa]|uniref:Uncharacterized protein n=2 Tax=Tilletia TaxID=13289 RepID=A0A8X7MKK8_9BASI|nr:hypothetical protein CF336_g6769 [Tilletia laevis]KAE8190778.1 hypothetical protein CF328_g5872 [Tilletia controversa]KAE8238803.1 hypothetical protein A4X06_0g8623 [Tilletia controversa]KAE8243907.1 hypothetical protein A4X03_0g7652 [Tilletia caries]
MSSTTNVKACSKFSSEITAAKPSALRKLGFVVSNRTLLAFVVASSADRALVLACLAGTALLVAAVRNVLAVKDSGGTIRGSDKNTISPALGVGSVATFWSGIALIDIVSDAGATDEAGLKCM